MGHKNVDTEQARNEAFRSAGLLADRALRFTDLSPRQDSERELYTRWTPDRDVEIERGVGALDGYLTLYSSFLNGAGDLYKVTVEYTEGVDNLPEVTTVMLDEEGSEQGLKRTLAVNKLPAILSDVLELIPETPPQAH